MNRHRLEHKIHCYISIMFRPHHLLVLLLGLPLQSMAKHAVLPGGDPDSIRFTDLFSLQIAEYEGTPYLNTEIDSMLGHADLEARFSALWAYHAYLYDNYAEAFRRERELLKLLPDPHAVRAGYDELLLADTAFQRLMEPSLRGTRVAPLHIDSAMRITAHFYYVHREGEKVVTHVCTGFNRVLDLGTSFDAAHHAAFGYMVVRNMDDPYAPFLPMFDPYREEMRANPSDERIKEVELLTYEQMALSPALREALIAEYERKAAYLAFELVK
jgi:hypothetical protein